MAIPTRVVRCDNCGSKIISAHAEVTSRAYDGDPLTFVCNDTAACRERQGVAPTVAVEMPSGVAEKDIPF